MKKILILGSRGMLGQELVVQAQKKDCDVVAWDRNDLDVTDFKKLKDMILELEPQVIYNAVAYNAVDACEQDKKEYEKMWKLNVEAPTELAKISKKIGATLVQYSSDYVFGAKQREIDYSGGYSEFDETGAVSKYGKSRVEAEKNISQILDNEKYYIIRLSKLFGSPASSESGKKAFFDFMLEKGKEAQKTGEKIKAVDGEVSKFTYAKDLALESISIVDENSESGIYHITNEGVCSWYEGLLELYKIVGFEDVVVEPVSPETFPRPAKRPVFSALKNTKRKSLRHFSEALRDYYGS